MKAVFCIFLLMPTVIWAATRVEKHEIAEKALLETHFFAEGKGMHMVPGFYEMYERSQRIPLLRRQVRAILQKKWGLTLDSEQKMVGLFKADHNGMGVGVLGCAACHSGKVMGRVIPGIGNKNIDVSQIGTWAGNLQRMIAPFSRQYRNHPDYPQLKRQAMEFVAKLGNERIGNLTQGMVPVSIIRQWFYQDAGLEVPHDMPRGAIKVPAFFGYGQKRPVGAFSDGFGDGDIPGWAVAVELVGGQTPDVVRRYFHRVEQLEHYLADLLPPAYPLEIDQAKANRGKAVFQQTCQRCHGGYEKDAEGHVIYEAPKWLPYQVVGTDRDRLNGNTEEFIRLVGQSSINDLIRVNPNYRSGFFAPKLYAIWARFPYLHNGSVPNLESLLTRLLSDQKPFRY